MREHEFAVWAPNPRLVRLEVDGLTVINSAGAVVVDRVPDVAVDDLDAAEPEVVALGAIKAADQPTPEEFRVYLDPAGHPFCTVLLGAG